uniref:MPN domain-containing protein n=1 Tax=Syphacia muris TaxID=451379 RepID=A0A0N5AMF8_9BILA
MDESIRLRLDPVGRLKAVMNVSIPDINFSVPLNRYYRSLNEVYRTAGFCVEENDLERAISLYIRFASLALELSKHKDYKNFSSVEKSKAEGSLKSALDHAEALKVRLREKYAADAVEAKRILEERRKMEAVKNVPVSTHEYAEIEAEGSPLSNDSNGIKAASQKGMSSGVGCSSCKMVIAGDIVENFRKKVEKNTSLNIETCAVLCGKMGSGGIYQITHAVIPKQDGAPDTCDMHNEEDIFAFQDTHNLITLGWIHTHPSQTAFLSSVDLHTHCAYQLMLPEAVAVVVAPKFNTFGVFRLTQEGMKEVGTCKQINFHPHDNANSLFCQCDDVQFTSDFNGQIIDLR